MVGKEWCEMASRDRWTAGQQMPAGSNILWPAVFDQGGALVAYVNDPDDVPLICAVPELIATCKRLVAAIDGTSGHDYTMPDEAAAEAARSLLERLGAR